MNDKKEEKQKDNNNSSIEDIIIPTQCPLCEIIHDEIALSTGICGGCDEPIKAVSKSLDNANDAEKESKSNDINTRQLWLCTICETMNKNTGNCLNCKSWKCKDCYFNNKKNSKNCIQCEKIENYDKNDLNENINENTIFDLEKNEVQRQNVVDNKKRSDSDECINKELETHDYEELNRHENYKSSRTNDSDNHEISSISDHDIKWECTKCNYVNYVSFVICDNCFLTWRCTQCTCINETNRNLCENCGKQNEAGIESKENNNKVRESVFYTDNWVCKLCTYINETNRKLCKACGKQNEAKMKSQKNNDKVKDPVCNTDNWECKQCTFINEKNRNLCEACGKQIEAAIESQKNNNKVEEPVVITDNWECKICTFKNKLTNILCESCGESWYCKSCTCVNDDMDSQICEACKKISIINIEENQIKNYWKCCRREQYEALCSNCKLKWYCFKCRIAGNIKSICKECKCWICSKCSFLNKKNDNNCSACGVVRIKGTIERQQDNKWIRQVVNDNNDNNNRDKLSNIKNNITINTIVNRQQPINQNAYLTPRTTSSQRCWFQLCTSTKFDEEDFCVECNLKYYKGGKYDEPVQNRMLKMIIVCSKCFKKNATDMAKCLNKGCNNMFKSNLFEEAKYENKTAKEEQSGQLPKFLWKPTIKIQNLTANSGKECWLESCSSTKFDNNDFCVEKAIPNKQQTNQNANTTPRPTSNQNTNVTKQLTNHYSNLARSRSSQNTTVNSSKKCWHELCPSTKFDEKDFCVECNLKYYEGGKYDEPVQDKKKKEIIVCSKCYRKSFSLLKHCKLCKNKFKK